MDLLLWGAEGDLILELLNPFDDLVGVCEEHSYKLFLVRMPAQSMYSSRGLASGMPFSVRVTRSSACRLVMLDSGLKHLRSENSTEVQMMTS